MGGTASVAIPFFPLLLEFENNQPDRSEPVPIIKIDEHQPMADLNGRLRVAIDCKELDLQHGWDW